MSSDGVRQPAPFVPGQRVVYTPSAKGWALEANADDTSRLVPGQVYRILEIQRDAYVVIEGYVHPGGGLYWTEFSPITASSSDEPT